MHEKSLRQLQAVHNAITVAWQQFHVELVRCEEESQQSMPPLPTLGRVIRPETPDFFLPMHPSNDSESAVTLRDGLNHQLHHRAAFTGANTPALLPPSPVQPLVRPEYSSHHNSPHESPLDAMMNIDPDALMEILQEFQNKRDIQTQDDNPPRRRASRRRASNHI
jgi:hypothetical protein